MSKTQIFVHPDAGNITQEWGMTPKEQMSSSNGRQLDFYNDIDDAHEFGHAFANVYDGAPIKNSNASNDRALQFENYMRARRGLSNTRILH
jgi:hypothetical protein